MYMFTVSDLASSEPIVTRGTFHVKVCSPGEVKQCSEVCFNSCKV